MTRVWDMWLIWDMWLCGEISSRWTWGMAPFRSSGLQLNLWVTGIGVITETLRIHPFFMKERVMKGKMERKAEVNCIITYHRRASTCDLFYTTSSLGHRLFCLHSYMKGVIYKSCHWLSESSLSPSLLSAVGCWVWVDDFLEQWFPALQVWATCVKNCFLTNYRF